MDALEVREATAEGLYRPSLERLRELVRLARFVALRSQNHLLLDDEPAFARFLSEIREFLAAPRPQA